MWLEMSRDEGYLPGKAHGELNEKYDRIGAMLSGLWKQWRDFSK